MREEVTWIVGTVGEVALGETSPLRCRLTGCSDMAFYGVDNFIDLWNPIEEAWHDVPTFHNVL